MEKFQLPQPKLVAIEAVYHNSSRANRTVITVFV